MTRAADHRKHPLTWDNAATTKAVPAGATNADRDLTTNRTSGRRLLPMMMHHASDRDTGARREAPAGALRVTTLAPEPSYAELRSRVLLALALVNHRRTHRGLSATDTATVHAALLGEWDAA